MEFRRSPKKRRLANMSWISSLIDLGSSAASQASQYQRNRSLMKYQYELNQRSLQSSPSALKQGLVAAGYNPMLALDGSVNAPSVSGSSVSAPDFRPDFSSAFTASKQRELMDAQKDDVKSSADLKRTQGEIAKTQSAADVALKTAEAEKIRKESESIDPRILRQNDRFGSGYIGDLMRLGRNLVEGAGFDFDAHPDMSRSSTPTSAKGVKVISDEQNRREKARGDAVRKRRMHH